MNPLDEKKDGRAARAKHEGTGMLDTSAAAWRALFGEYLQGNDPLTDVARRHGVRYSAAVRVGRLGGWMDFWCGLQAA